MKFERALITGASSGIGEALAHLLTQKGISLIVSGRNQERLEKLKAEQILVVDLQNREERKKIIETIRQKTPDLVINCAGFGFMGDLLTISVEEQLAMVEVNVMAALEITLEAARALVRAGKKGVILNVSSVAGEFPCPGESVYGATKAFLTKASQALDVEVRVKGISILASCPGMVATDFTNRAAKKQVNNLGSVVMTPQFAAEEIWRQIEKRKKKHIFNWQYRVLSWFAKYLVPNSLIEKIIWKQIKQRT